MDRTEWRGGKVRGVEKRNNAERQKEGREIERKRGRLNRGRRRRVGEETDSKQRTITIWNKTQTTLEKRKRQQTWNGEADLELES